MKINYSSTDITRQNPQESKIDANFKSFKSTFDLQSIKSKLKQKSFIIQPKNIKARSMESFQKGLKGIEEFNTYIEKEYGKMLKQKSQNPTLIIPSGFVKFIHSKLFQNFIQKIYEYMDILIEYDKKYQNIKKLTSKFQYVERYQPTLQKMRFQSNQLQQKCKEISYFYMGILLSHGQSKMIFKDQYFFETMIYFIAQILKSTFDEEDYVLIQEQLNRIFRTNAFNLIKRRHDEDNTYKKYPSLKQAKYQSSTFGVSRMIKRLSIQKRFNYSVNIKPQNIERLKKPVQINLSSFGSVKSRSPLISSFYPSSKEKLYEFGKSTRQKQSLVKQARLSNTFFNRKK